MVVKVAQRRKELGMTQAQLAKVADVGQHTVSDIESGLHWPRVDIVIRISRALFRTVEEFFDIDGDGKAHPI